MKGEYFLLRTKGNIRACIDFLLNNNWETRPNLNIEWIIRTSQDLYVLTDYKNTSILIGFMVFNYETKHCDYLEILPQYRNRGYGTDIVERIGIQSVSITPTQNSFWNRFDIDIEFV